MPPFNSHTSEWEIENIQTKYYVLLCIAFNTTGVIRKDGVELDMVLHSLAAKFPIYVSEYTDNIHIQPDHQIHHRKSHWHTP